MKRFALACAATLCLTFPALPAFAGEQFIDGTGFAVSGYDVVAYRNLAQSPIGTAQPQGVPGLASITADYNGATFAFSTPENRDTFLSDPDHFAPVFDGHCAYGVSRGGKVPGNPNLWRIVDDKLYLNITKVVVGFWEEDIPGNISTADSNWPKIEPEDASGNVIPQFASTAPLTD